MHQPPTYMTWLITCRSSEELRSLQEWLADRIDLDRIVTETVRVVPNGVKQAQTVQHRLHDYFSDIRAVADAEAKPASFRLVFHRRPDAGRYWKDLMVDILQEVENAPQKVSIEIASKGELEISLEK